MAQGSKSYEKAFLDSLTFSPRQEREHYYSKTFEPCKEHMPFETTLINCDLSGGRKILDGQ